jgi:hypothetical protein
MMFGYWFWSLVMFGAWVLPPPVELAPEPLPEPRPEPEGVTRWGCPRKLPKVHRFPW